MWVSPSSCWGQRHFSLSHWLYKTVVFPPQSFVSLLEEPVHVPQAAMLPQNTNRRGGGRTTLFLPVTQTVPLVITLYQDSCCSLPVVWRFALFPCSSRVLLADVFTNTNLSSPPPTLCVGSLCVYLKWQFRHVKLLHITKLLQIIFLLLLQHHEIHVLLSIPNAKTPSCVWVVFSLGHIYHSTFLAYVAPVLLFTLPSKFLYISYLHDFPLWGETSMTPYHPFIFL